MSEAKVFQQRLGEELAGLLGGEFRSYRSRLELRRVRAEGADVILIGGSTKWSPQLTIAFHFGRAFDRVRPIEKALGLSPMLCHIQQYSVNAHAMRGLGWGPGGAEWTVDLRRPSPTVATSVQSGVQKIAFPFFERFTDLRAARSALADGDSWCFGAREGGFRYLLLVDAALGDLEHFRAWSACLSPFYAQQAVELLARLG